MFQFGYIPLLTKGWLRHQSKVAKHRRAADGVVAQATRFTNAFRSIACERPPRPRLFSERIHVSVWVHSPPYKGVAAASIKSREATEEPQTGWSLRRHVSQTHSEASLVSDHPVRAFFRNGSILLMARPPLLSKEGNAPTPNRCQT